MSPVLETVRPLDTFLTDIRWGNCPIIYVDFEIHMTYKGNDAITFQNTTITGKFITNLIKHASSSIQINRNVCLS